MAFVRQRWTATWLLRFAMVVLGVAVLSVFSLESGAPSEAHASAALQYQAGYSVQDGWLCYGWSSGTYHCTHNWHYSNGHYVSTNPSWVPNVGYSTNAPVSSPVSTPVNSPVSSPVSFVSNSGGGNTSGYPWGYCTWGAAALSWDNVAYLGNAEDWFVNARARGMATGYTPRVGATAVFQPGVQGAGGLGHVAHVTAVYGDGTFEVEETDFYGYGGSFGVFSYRHVYNGAGVSFIY